MPPTPVATHALQIQRGGLTYCNPNKMFFEIRIRRRGHVSVWIQATRYVQKQIQVISYASELDLQIWYVTELDSNSMACFRIDSPDVTPLDSMWEYQGSKCMEMHTPIPEKYFLSAECAFAFRKWLRTDPADMALLLHLH